MFSWLAPVSQFVMGLNFSGVSVSAVIIICIIIGGVSFIIRGNK